MDEGETNFFSDMDAGVRAANEAEQSNKAGPDLSFKALERAREYLVPYLETGRVECPKCRGKEVKKVGEVQEM